MNGLSRLGLALALGVSSPAHADDCLALQQAAFTGKAPRVEALLAAGADPDCADANGHTPLMRAAQRGQAAAAAALLAAGAQVDRQDARGYTALIWAAQEGQREVAALLLTAGARVGAREAHGYTALMWAVRQGHADLARLLLAHGANPKDGPGPANAVALAARHQDPAIRGLFRAPALTPAVRWRTIGESVEGRSIRLAVAGSGPRGVLVLAGLHGDEPAGPPLVERLLAEVEGRPALLAGQRLLALPAANPDGLAARSRTNARGIDLNRNFPHRWRPSRQGRYHGGAAPLSEPESRAIAALIAAERPAVIVAIHAPLACTNYDGAAARQLARAMADASGYPLRPAIGYETPGSLGHLAAERMGIPIVTLELGVEPIDRLWDRVGEALLLPLQPPQD